MSTQNKIGEKSSSISSSSYQSQTSTVSKKEKSKLDHIPRPKNCFMTYRQDKQLEIVKGMGNSKLNNKEISKIAGRVWNSEPESIKQFYRRKAEIGKLEHAKLYPDYKYSPKKIKRYNRNKFIVSEPTGTKKSGKPCTNILFHNQTFEECNHQLPSCSEIVNDVAKFPSESETNTVTKLESYMQDTQLFHDHYHYGNYVVIPNSDVPTYINGSGYSAPLNYENLTDPTLMDEYKLLESSVAESHTYYSDPLNSMQYSLFYNNCLLPTPTYLNLENRPINITNSHYRLPNYVYVNNTSDRNFENDFEFPTTVANHEFQTIPSNQEYNSYDDKAYHPMKYLDLHYNDLVYSDTSYGL